MTMAMRLALTEDPPPSRHWDDPDWDGNASVQRLTPDLEFELEHEDSAGPRTGCAWNAGDLVVAASAESAALLRRMADGAKWSRVGRVRRRSRGEQTEKGEGLQALRSTGGVCTEAGYAELFTNRQQGSTVSITVAVLEGRTLSPEECYSWTHTLIGACQPQRVIAFGPLPCGQFLGFLRGLRGNEELSSQVLLLHTSAFSCQVDERLSLHKAAPQLSLMPSGVLVEGLPASIMAYCQVRSLPALLFCCGFRDAAPARGADPTASLSTLAPVVEALNSHFQIGLGPVAEHIVAECAAVLLQQGTADNDMYI